MIKVNPRVPPNIYIKLAANLAAAIKSFPNRKFILAIALICLSSNLAAQTAQHRYTDHHVHLQDSASVQLGFRMLRAFKEVPTRTDSLVLTAYSIIERLDRAGFQKAWIISNAYWFGSPYISVENEYGEVKQQNDWTAESAARYPRRLVAFLSINPLKPYALQEIERCGKTKRFAGLKLHFANSQVNLFDTNQVAQLQQVFELAGKHHLILLVHLRNGKEWNGQGNAEVFARSLLPFAKKTKLVLAHMGGWGKFDTATLAAFNVLADYLHKRSPKSRNLYFDISAVVPAASAGDEQAGYKAGRDEMAILQKRIREIGADHILFGTDWPLVDIDPYIQVMESALGKPVTQEILRNNISGY